MSLKDRLEKVEKQTNDKEPKEIWFIVTYDGQPKPSEAELEAAEVLYKKTHPDWASRPFNTIYPSGELPHE